MNRILGQARLVVLAGLLSSCAACAVNPATGQRQFMLLSEGREIEMGREADRQVTEAYGLYPSAELQAFVRGIGEDLAARSERPALPWSFKVVDDPVVNAFALPRGFIFITRGILASLNSEAELAGVLGHEIGHVTARHSASQLSRQQLQQIGLGVGAAVSSDIASAAGVLSAGFQLLNLKYSRGDESQSDELGVRYMSRAGYDPNALLGVFQTLALAAGGGGRLPEWQSTHPNPENREAKIREMVASSGQDYSGYRSGRDEYLLRLEGLVYGVNPREGFFEGSLFRHPDMAFAMDFPSGWETANQKSQVGAVADDESAIWSSRTHRSRAAWTRPCAASWASQASAGAIPAGPPSTVSRRVRLRSRRGPIRGGSAEGCSLSATAARSSGSWATQSRLGGSITRAA